MLITDICFDKLEHDNRDFYGAMQGAGNATKIEQLMAVIKHLAVNSSCQHFNPISLSQLFDTLHVLLARKHFFTSRLNRCLALLFLEEKFPSSADVRRKFNKLSIDFVLR